MAHRGGLAVTIPRPLAFYGVSTGKSYMMRKLVRELPGIGTPAQGYKPLVQVRLQGPVKLQSAGYQVARALGYLTERFNEKHDYWVDVNNMAPGAISGPQQMFGRIYQWLEFGSDDRDLEPIRSMLRDHIVETLPVGSGDIVLRQPVQQRRVYSVRLAALQHGVHQVTARKILTLAGIAPAERGRTV